MTASPTIPPRTVLPSAPPPAPPAPAASALPDLPSPLPPSDILARLDTASKRGRLAGFSRSGPGFFSVAAHGHPFDAILMAHHHPGPAAHLSFELRFLRRLPAVFLLTLLFSIWPGVWFMDELVAQYLPNLWRPWVTYYWYLPITILPLPWMWASLMRKSRTSTTESARGAIEKIAAELNAPTTP